MYFFFQFKTKWSKIRV